MKNIAKKFLLILFFSVIILLVSSTKSEAANTINSITMNVFINPDGSAQITEVWDTKLDKGTEGYKPYGNLKNCEITNFTVSDDSGNVYETLSYWNTDATFDSKAYRCGINKTHNGVELCWGISKYGNRRYTLKYKITNIVNQYKDSQGIYFSFMPKEMDQAPKNVRIIISSKVAFTKENSQIWAFGYPSGNIEFDNGSIYMSSNGTLNSSSYMTALVKIENGTFNTRNKVSKTFDDVYKEAMSDVKKEESKGNKAIEYLILTMVGVFSIIGIQSIVMAFMHRKPSQFDFGPDGKKLPKMKDIEYFMDIPCNNDLYRAYWIMYRYDIPGADKCKRGLLGAILLTWIKEGFVDIVKSNNGKNDYAINLTRFKVGRNDLETALLAILREASGENKILEKKEFKKWSAKNYTRLDSWFNKVLTHVNNELIDEKLITITTEEKIVFGKSHKNTRKRVDSSLKSEAINLMGLRKFLLDYSLIAEREAIEVSLWEQYLIYAQLLGIADKVEEQFKNLYPEFNDVSNLNMDYVTICTRQMAYGAITSANRARTRAEHRDSYSSGGGGSSYSGGGGSAGGSSSGGGFR